MKKLLYITPHLSTGGLPQYLYKSIEHFSKYYDVFLVEWTDVTGGVLVAVRNKIVSILPSDKFFTLGESKDDIYDIIKNISPDIIHFQEEPHTFIDTKILDWIYSDDRNYNIVVSTHGSFTDPSLMPYLADKFVLVSDWSKDVFDNHFKGSIPCEVWEYELDEVEYDKIQSKIDLGFDLDYKHVLHVGLFTSGKNQKHIIEVAKKCLGYKIKFHFVGNQAVNFENYWKPLMDDLPSNCIWHNERSDVDRFYKASDLFMFPSLYELNPISIKEALSYKLPIFITKLETYKGKYDGIATYIDNNVDNTKKLLLTHFGIEESDNPKITIMHILTDIDTEREVRSMQSLTKLTDYGFDYQIVVSKRYTELPPAENCAYPEIISMEPGGKLTPAHYGCYLGHRKAFEMGLETDSDYLFISECDTIIDIPYEDFVDKVKFAAKKIDEDNLAIFSFGYHHNDTVGDMGDYYLTQNITGLHGYLISKKQYHFISDMYKNSKWNVADLFFANNLVGKKVGIFKELTTKQAGGFSILEKTYNNDRF
jgi:glycosyltransferase involved in cell wall biosynthesis/GR25 family glycosyltransferase involved in LPS biosynthesis